MIHSLSYSKKYKLLLFLLLLFLFVPLLTNMKYSYDLFVHAVDFSIYQQAFYEIASGVSLNPYLTIRDVNILNDHFDPIIYLSSVWVKVFGESVSNLMLFEWIWFFFGGLSIYFISLNERFNYREAVFVLFLYVFSRGALQGVEYPLHTTTWSIFPCVWAAYFYIKRDYAKFSLAFLFLITFREIYYFSMLGVFLYFLFKKDVKKSLVSFFVLFFLMLFIFKLRAIFFGETVAYATKEKELVFNFEIVGILKRFVLMKYPWKIFFPPVLIIIMAYFKASDRKKYSDDLLKILLFIAPGFCIHVLVGNMVHHHSIPFVMPLYTFLACQKLNFVFEYKKIMLGLLFVLVILCSSSRYTKMFSYLLNGERLTGVNFDLKRKSFKSISKNIREIPIEASIKASGSVIPFILKGGRRIYTIGAYSKKLEDYDYLLLERNKQFIPYPLNFEQYHKIESRCRSFAKTIIYEDFNFILMKGPIPQSCFEI